MKVHRTTDEMVLLIEQHKKEIWEWKQKESEWIKTKNLADGYKKIIDLDGGVARREEESQHRLWDPLVRNMALGDRADGRGSTSVEIPSRRLGRRRVVSPIVPTV